MLIICSECGKEFSDKAAACPNCGCPVEKKVDEKEKCPMCGAYDWEFENRQYVVPGKTKTSYKANLNPLKPFTLVDKKEKIVRKEQAYNYQVKTCKKCGYTTNANEANGFWFLVFVFVAAIIIGFIFF